MQESKAQKGVCSVKIYCTPCTTMHNLHPGKKSSEKTSVTQANAKVMFHTITSFMSHVGPVSTLFQTND